MSALVDTEGILLGGGRSRRGRGDDAGTTQVLSSLTPHRPHRHPDTAADTADTADTVSAFLWADEARRGRGDDDGRRWTPLFLSALANTEAPKSLISHHHYETRCQDREAAPSHHRRWLPPKISCESFVHVRVHLGGPRRSKSSRASN